LKAARPGEFAEIAGISEEGLQTIESSSEYVPMMLVSLACQFNKSHGDTNPERTSVTECIKGAVIRLPSSQTPRNEEEVSERSVAKRSRPIDRGPERPVPFMDPKSGRLLGFSVNLITFLILGYFLGGFALNPVLGLASCEGLSPCLGSVLGLFISAMGSLAYTYYYFTRKV